QRRCGSSPAAGYETNASIFYFQSSMNLPPDKARLLRQYDNEKKWDLICDQERFQVKNPPHTYIQKLRGYLDPGVTRKFRRRVQESTKVLRELEISLRTNHIGWVREFLNDENRGLDVLVEYLSFAQCLWLNIKFKLKHYVCLLKLYQILTSAIRCSYGTVPNSKTIKNSRLVSQKDDVHVCIMCLRAIMNYQYGFNMVMSHAHAVNEIALSLNNKNSRTKALVLELLAAVCLVRGGHEIILSAFDNFKEVCKEKQRFERLMDYFRCEEGNIDYMVACMQFINIVVHSVEDMNFRVHLQYEFTKLGLDDYLEKCKHTESDKLSVQIQAYLDNVFDVGGLLEDAETKNAALEKVEELEEHLSHVSAPPSLDHQHCSLGPFMRLLWFTSRVLNVAVTTLRRVIKEKDAAFQRHFNIERRLLELEQQGTIRLHKKADGDIAIEPLGVGGGGGVGSSGLGIPLGDMRQLSLGSTAGLTEPGGPDTSLPPAMIMSDHNAPVPPPPPPPAPPLPDASPSVILSVGLSGRSPYKMTSLLCTSLRYFPLQVTELMITLLYIFISFSSTAIRIKKPIKTKFRLPVFNWTALKPNQINGTVFNEIDDERVLEELDLERFEELFKTRSQGPVMDLSCTKSKVAQKTVNKVTLLDANRSKNLAITLRKANKTTEEICKAIEKFDLKALPVDFVECLMRFLPTEGEVKVMRQYERERRPLDQLAEEDRFMLFFSKIERLTQRMNIITFVGNFSDNINMLTPQLNAVIAASGSVKSAPKLKRVLEIILALGNYMNSSKRGCVYGFKLQSLDLLLDTKSTDRKMTLLHYIALILKEKYPELANFYNELHFVEKAAAVSLENVLLDVRELGKGMDLIRRECSLHDHSVLKGFVQTSDTQLDKLQKDAKTAEEAFNNVVNYFGESAKTTPPSVFFPVFVRFIKAYKVRTPKKQGRALAASVPQDVAYSPRPNNRKGQLGLTPGLQLWCLDWSPLPSSLIPFTPGQPRPAPPHCTLPEIVLSMDLWDLLKEMCNTRISVCVCLSECV
uniref:Formin-like 3 n=1 Tax=Sander lucioperca TaxID=283035 RepID=A0A8D0DDJ9_SANLU